MKDIIDYFKKGFKRAVKERRGARRIGAELKFPMVDGEGNAVRKDDVRRLWQFLGEKGWHLQTDSFTGDIVGATIPGPMNDTVASSETGFCKVEFSLAHVANIHELSDKIHWLRSLLREFSDTNEKYLLGFGTQPKTPPSKHLKMEKARNVFWEKVFGSNRHIPPEKGDDVHLFTVSASSQIHLDVSFDEAVRAVNVFNGLSGAQLALTANSNIWKGDVDNNYKCVGEMFWDWWNPGSERFGMPHKPFKNLDDYVRIIGSMSPVYVKREGIPIGLPDYESFNDYYFSDTAWGINPEGEKIRITPEPADIDQHCTFYWYDARISRYFTLENRPNDQQPPNDLVVIAALSTGILSMLNEAEEEISKYDWNQLIQARVTACKDALEGQTDKISLFDFAWNMLSLAEEGLSRRGLGEEIYLAPLHERLNERCCPADEAELVFKERGISGLLEKRRL